MAIKKALFPFEVPYHMRQEDKLYFLHLEKTAGTSLTELLDTQFPAKDRLQVMWQHQIKDETPDELDQYRLFRGHMNYNFHKRLHRKPITITMLREPIDRIVSLYYFWRYSASHQDDIPWDVQIAVEKELEDFLEDERLQPALMNYQTRTILTNKQNMMQNRTDESLLARGIDRLHEFPFVGLMERFDDSVALLYFTFGWYPKNIFQPPKTKSNPDRPSVDEIPQHICERIAEMNRVDIALYEYAVELFQARFTHMLHHVLALNSAALDAALPVYEATVRFDDHETEAFGKGWHYAEEKLRWTGPQTEAQMFFKLATDRDLQVEVVIQRAIKKDILDSFQLLVNGQPIAIEQFRREGSTVFMGVISKDDLRSSVHMTEITFRVARTIQPSNQDGRLLGLAFESIHISPRYATRE